jgi:prepilin-type N-terminal cleavage/methylation domain-containing protein
MRFNSIAGKVEAGLSSCGAPSKRAERTERGFTLTELMIAMVVFTIVVGSVALLVGKSQSIFRTEQGVSEMDQNARLLIDFLTRDIQQSKENALGFGNRFRSIYSYNGPEGRTDEVTVVSAETESKIPAAALPMLAASKKEFSARDGYVELLPNGVTGATTHDVINTLTPGEEFILSSTRADGSLQFDFLKANKATLTHDGLIGLSFQMVLHKGVEPEVPFGEPYEGGNFAVRPVTLKRYFVDRQEKENPVFSLQINDGKPIAISRNVVAFQLRYLEVRDGEVEGQWVKQQNISRLYKTIALEVTMTARTEIKNDPQAERVVTLASVIRPRSVPGGAYGSSPSTGGGPSFPGVPGDGGIGGGGNGDGGNGGGSPGSGPGLSAGGDGSGFGPNGGGYGSGASGDGSGALGNRGVNHVTRRIGKQPKLGERLNPRNY